MKLKPMSITGAHPEWCGPTALSILTGRSINHCALLVAKQRNRWGDWYKGKGTSKQVKGVSASEMRRALASMGFIMVKVKVPWKDTLRKYMAERGGDQYKNSMLINITDHWVTAKADVISDNFRTSHYADHPKKLKKMVNGWIVKTKPKS